MISLNQYLLARSSLFSRSLRSLRARLTIHQGSNLSTFTSKHVICSIDNRFLNSRSILACTQFSRHESTLNKPPGNWSDHGFEDQVFKIKPEDLETLEKPLTANGNAFESIETSKGIIDLPEHLLTASDIGLTWFAPTSLVYNVLKTAHCDFQMPWILTIASATVILRLCVFPLIIKTFRNSDKLSALQTKLRVIVDKSPGVKKRDDPVEILSFTHEYTSLMKVYYKFMFKMLLPPICQATVFSSFFLTIREMSYFPLPSLKTAGIGHLIDLTVPDPYFILPIITACSTFLVLKAGVDFGNLGNPGMKYIKYFVPPVVLIATSQFPAAICVYWCTNNIVSLIQSTSLRIPALRKFLKLPENPSPPAFADPGLAQGLAEAAEIVKKGAFLRQQEHLRHIQERRNKMSEKNS